MTDETYVVPDGTPWMLTRFRPAAARLATHHKEQTMTGHHEDLITRLRHPAPTIQEAMTAMADAADEIGRLRTAAAHWKARHKITENELLQLRNETTPRKTS